VKRQAVTGLAARARLAEDGAAHHLPLAVDVEAGCVAVAVPESATSAAVAALAVSELLGVQLLCAGLCPRQDERREQYPHKPAD
jgi:hypothetical protein